MSEALFFLSHATRGLKTNFATQGLSIRTSRLNGYQQSNKAKQGVKKSLSWLSLIVKTNKTYLLVSSASDKSATTLRFCA